MTITMDLSEYGKAAVGIAAGAKATCDIVQDVKQIFQGESINKESLTKAQRIFGDQPLEYWKEEVNHFKSQNHGPTNSFVLSTFTRRHLPQGYCV